MKGIEKEPNNTIKEKRKKECKRKRENEERKKGSRTGNGIINNESKIIR